MNLAELKGLAESATPGPWTSLLDDSQSGSWHNSHYINSETRQVVSGDTEYFKKSDAEFITAANPATILKMIEAIEKMRETLEWIIEPKHKHNDPYTRAGCFQERAMEALGKIQEILK